MTISLIDATNPEVLEVAVDTNADGYIRSEAKVSKIYEYSDEMEIDFEKKIKI